MNICKRLLSLFSALLVVLAVIWGAIPAAVIAGENVLPPPEKPFQGVSNRTLEGSVPEWPVERKAPAGAPNVLLILVDDAGFGNPATFGGPVSTPNYDRLAAEGLRYNRFHVTALCSPSRAALISGRNQHSVGFGSVAELSGGWPGYDAHWPKSAASIAQILKGNGYSTAALGKWHLTPGNQTGPYGPFDQWPAGIGFDYFWGFLGGESDQYHPLLCENTKIIGVPNDKTFYLNTAMADKAIAWITDHQSVSPDRPFFIYYATGSSHAPHQVPNEWSDKYKGKFDGGWDKLREETFERQKKLGILPADSKLTERSAAFAAWDSLSASEKTLFTRQMEVYAGYQENTDHEIGRVIDHLKKLGIKDNTAVVFIWGDNGASLEGTETGSFNEMTMQNGIVLSADQQIELIKEYGGLQAWGGPTMQPHYAAAWALAGNTPFKWGKQVASHLGGTRDGMVISWPKRIKDAGGIRSQFTHLIDIAPTLLEVAGIEAPTEVDGVKQMPLHGVSFAYSFDDAKAPERHKQQYFEMWGNRAMYKDGWWLACRTQRIPWRVDSQAIEKLSPRTWDPDSDPAELYDLNSDFTQAVDLSAKYPEKVKELKALFWEEARKYQVLPLLGSMSFYFGGKYSPPKGGATKHTYLPGTENLCEGVAPHIYNHSYTMSADLVVPEGGAEGVIVADSDYLGGFGLYVQDRKPHFTYSFMGVKDYTLTSSDNLPSGKVTLRYQFIADHPGERGTGGTHKLFINDKQVAEGRMEHTVALQFTDYAGFDIGKDNGNPVSRTYESKSPFPFTGTIEKVEFDIQ